MKSHAGILVAAAVLAAGLLICTRNNAPQVPILSGPTNGRAGDTLEFQVKSADPEGDAISYSIDWGEGGDPGWGPLVASGEARKVSHVFGTGGTLHLRARARDEAGAESGWSDDHELVMVKPEIETPSVTYQVFGVGAMLMLTWQPIVNADGYEVVVDGVKDWTTSTMYVVEGPAADISVSAYRGGVHGDPWQLDCRAVVTTVVEVYGLSDPDPQHPSGFGFDESGGECREYTMEPTNWLLLDYVMDDRNLDGMDFCSPNWYNPPYNEEGNCVASSDDDFENSTRAEGVFDYRTRCEAGETYYLWIDPSDDGWDPYEDHFAKAYVESVEGAKVTMKVAYQRVTGLDWLVTD